MIDMIIIMCKLFIAPRYYVEEVQEVTQLRHIHLCVLSSQVKEEGEVSNTLTIRILITSFPWNQFLIKLPVIEAFLSISPSTSSGW